MGTPKVVVEVGCTAALHAASCSRVERASQGPRGRVVHDDGPGARGRCHTSDLTTGTLREGKSTIVGGATGHQEGPTLGVVQDGVDRAEGALHLRHQNYGVDSPCVLAERQGYVEDRSADHCTKGYYKATDGSTYEKAYRRGKSEAHFVRVECSAVTELDKSTFGTTERVDLVRESPGHPPADVMTSTCKNYGSSRLGPTVPEVRVWARRTGCRACQEGRVVYRRRRVSGRVVYVQYINYDDTDGTHFDCLPTSQEWGLLLVKSHTSRVQWVYSVGYDFDASVAKDSLEQAFGLYKYAGREVGLVRPDADPRLQPLGGRTQRVGLRYYMAPVGVKTPGAERPTRAERDTVGTLTHSLEYETPGHWTPHVVEEAGFLVAVRYSDRLKMSPRESFYKQRTSCREDLKVHFGQVTSCTDTQADSGPRTSRPQYGAAVGRDCETGDLYLEGPLDKRLDKVHLAQSTTPVDESTRAYYLNYDRTGGYRYSRRGGVPAVAALQYELYGTPVPSDTLLSTSAPERLRPETHPPSRVGGGSAQVLSSYERQALFDGEVLGALPARSLPERVKVQPLAV